MKEIRVQPLTNDVFRPYGEYAHLINPSTTKLGESPIEFFRDMITVKLGKTTSPSIGVNRVEKREPIINVSEYHNYTSEGILPLDGDVLIHVGEATHDGKPDLTTLKVFYVPKGTFISLHPGVWHHASYTVDTDYVNILIVLPERTYVNDCQVVDFAEEDYRRITYMGEEDEDYGKQICIGDR